MCAGRLHAFVDLLQLQDADAESDALIELYTQHVTAAVIFVPATVLWHGSDHICIKDFFGEELTELRPSKKELIDDLEVRVMTRIFDHQSV